MDKKPTLQILSRPYDPAHLSMHCVQIVTDPLLIRQAQSPAPKTEAHTNWFCHGRFEISDKRLPLRAGSQAFL